LSNLGHDIGRNTIKPLILRASQLDRDEPSAPKTGRAVLVVFTRSDVSLQVSSVGKYRYSAGLDFGF
jgi:hypothetical protein